MEELMQMLGQMSPAGTAPGAAAAPSGITPAFGAPAAGTVPSPTNNSGGTSSLASMFQTMMPMLQMLSLMKHPSNMQTARNDLFNPQGTPQSQSFVTDPLGHSHAA